ncbi:MAG: hypothetical protein QM702_03675 [Rubrivivax sp.]
MKAGSARLRDDGALVVKGGDGNDRILITREKNAIVVTLNAKKIGSFERSAKVRARGHPGRQGQ